MVRPPIDHVTCALKVVDAARDALAMVILLFGQRVRTKGSGMCRGAMQRWQQCDRVKEPHAWKGLKENESSKIYGRYEQWESMNYVFSFVSTGVR